MNEIDKAQLRIHEIEQTHNQYVQYLTSCEQAPNKMDTIGRTPLHYALEMDGDDITHTFRVRTISRLIEKGANPNAVDSEGATPLHYAIIYNRQNCIEPLIRMGANPNAQTHAQKLTPAHIALIENQRANLEALFACGASADIACAKGWCVRSRIPASWHPILPPHSGARPETSAKAEPLFSCTPSRLR